MNRIVTTIGLTVIVWSTLNAGGGKNIAPVAAAVAPIETVDPSPWYLGAGLVLGRFYHDHGNCEYEDRTYGLMVRGGYEWNPYIGIEVRGIRTFWDADPLGGEKLQHIGIFAKPSYPLSEDLNIYGLAGYGWTKTTLEADATSLPIIDEKGFSWGIGLEYDLSDKADDFEEDTYYDRVFDGQADQEKGWGLFIDYQRLLVKSGMPDLDVVSVGVTYDF